MRTANLFHRFHFCCLTSMRMVRVREKVFRNSSGFRFNVTFVDCTSVFVKSVFETSLSFTYLYCMDAGNGSDGVSPAVCTLPMVRCGSLPVARLYHAKNEAPGEEAVPAWYLTIIPRARMASESIAHEAEGRMGYWLRAHSGSRNNCFSKIQLVGQKYRE